MKRTAAAFLLALALPSSSAVAAPLSSDAIAGVAVEVGGVRGWGARVDGLGLEGRRPRPIDVWLVPPADTPALGWIKAAVTGTSTPKATTLLFTDADLKVRQRVAIDTASILEVEFPGADASAHRLTEKHIRVRLQPEGLAFTSPGTQIAGTREPPAIMPVFFKLIVDDLHCERVIKVSPFTIRPASGGTAPFALTVTMPERDADDWTKWAHDELVAGATANLREGKLQYFTTSPGAKINPFMTVELVDMRMKGYEYERVPAERGPAMVKFVLEVDRAKLRVPVANRTTKQPSPGKKKLPSKLK